MVLGEPQILGQIKTAYGYAAEFKTAGLILNRFLHKAFSVAKRVMIIGAGEMCELAARHFVSNGISKVLVTTLPDS